MSQPYKRWYDRQPRLSQAVRLMFLFPAEIKDVICDGLILLANRQYDQAEAENKVRSMGPEKVMGVHKSKKRRREYDTNDLLHKAMNYLYILSDDNQDAMAEHILQLVRYIQEYLAACQAFRTDASLEDVAIITQTYVKRGPAEVEAFLNRVRSMFHKRLMRKPSDQAIDFLDGALVQDTLMGVTIKPTRKR